MPRVRVYEGDQVAPAETTGARHRAADMAAGGLAIAQGVTNLGRAGMDFAQAQEDINLRFDDTESQKAAQRYQIGAAKITSEFQMETGSNAYLKRADTDEALKKLREEMLGSATNDRMRRMADDRIAGLYGADTVKIGEHARKELRTEQDGTLKAQVVLSGEDAAANWDRPDLMGAHMDTMKTSVDKLGELNGWSADRVRLEKMGAVSAVHKDVSNGFLARGDIDGALIYLGAHADEMNANDELSIRSALREPMRIRQGDIDVDRAETTMPVPDGASTKDAAPAGTTFDAMVAVTAQSESNNRERDAAGRLITSPAGAQGKMQVMPGTNTDPGFGVRAAKDNSDAERTRVGRDYLAAMLKRYGNDPAKAWAAYNAGPGRVDDAIAAGGDWLARLPKETRDYVAKNVAAVGGGGAQQGPRTWDKGAVYAQIDALADKENWSPERRETAKERADVRIQRDEQLLVRQERQASRDASEWVLKNPNFTSLSQMPSTIRDRLSPEDRVQYMEAGERNAKPRDVPANGAQALVLTLMSIRDPKRFEDEDLGKYAGQITNSELEGFMKAQETLIKNQDRWSPRQGAMAAIEFGKKVGQVKLTEQDYAAVYRHMERELTDLHKKTGQVSTKDYEAAFLNATRNVKTVSTLGFGGEEPVYRLTATDKQRAAAIARLRRNGINDPSEDEIQTVFRVDGLK
jgi:soluble lytic murein transglycosylase